MISWLHLRLTNWSWDWNSLIMLYFEFQSHDRFVSHKNNHEIKISNNAFLNFNLMINMLAASVIMRSKLKKVILISWKMPGSGDRIIIRNFDLMKTGKIILISWSKNNSISYFYLMKFDLLTLSHFILQILISLLKVYNSVKLR